MNKFFRVFFVLSVFLIAACSSKPGDEDAFNYIREHESVPGQTKVANIVRKNGWQEGESSYQIEYTYDLVAEADYDDVVFEVLKEIEKNPEQFFPSGMNSLNWQLVTAVSLSDASTDNEWRQIGRANMSNDDGGRLMLDIGRRIKNSEISDRLKSYISNGDKNGFYDRMRNLLFAINGAESVGFRSDTKKGGVYMNKVWKLAFQKTEKGWVLK